MKYPQKRLRAQFLLLLLGGLGGALFFWPRHTPQMEHAVIDPGSRRDTTSITPYLETDHAVPQNRPHRTPSAPPSIALGATDRQGRLRRTLFPAQGQSLSETRAALLQVGAEALGWNPAGGYDARLTPNALAELKRRGLRAEPTPLPITASLRHALSKETILEVVAVCASPADAEALKARLGAGFVVGDSVQATVASTTLAEALSNGAGILAADLRRVAEPCNNIARGERFLGADAIQLNATWMTGEGEVIAICDTGLSTGIPGFREDTFHPGLRDRLLRMSVQPWGTLSGVPQAIDPDCYDGNGHGTHVASIALGDGAGSTNRRFRGIAPGARLFFQNNTAGNSSVCTPPTLAPLFEEAYAAGARLHSNSWAESPNNDSHSESEPYALEAWALDRFVWEHPDFLPIFGAGNSGTDLDADGVADFGSLISSAAKAKNGLAVGAAESYRLEGDPDGVPMNTYANGYGVPAGKQLMEDPRSSAPGANPDVRGLAAFSCRGPLPDGRIKPDIVAPGTRIIAARGPEVEEGKLLTKVATNTEEEVANYIFMDGTSMATPNAAGVCAVLRQWARETLGVAEPSSALTRALLLSGSASLFPGQFGDGPAREIPSAAPNGAEGFGLISLARTITPATGLPKVETFAYPESGSLEFPVEVGEEGTLRAVLTWVDWPAQLYSPSALVNDLDLALEDGEGNVVAHPNGLAEPDRVNVAERIEAQVAPGTYTLRVTSHRVPFPGGAAALVAQVPGGAQPMIAHTALKRLAPGAQATLEARLLWSKAKGDTITLETSADGKTWAAQPNLTLSAPTAGRLLLYRLTANGAETAGPFAVAVGELSTLTVADEGTHLLATPAVGQKRTYATGEVVRASARETLVYHATDIPRTFTIERRTAKGWTLSDAEGNLLALGNGSEALFAMPEGNATLTWHEQEIDRTEAVKVTFGNFFGRDTVVWVPKGGSWTLPPIGHPTRRGDFVAGSWQADTGEVFAPGATIGPLYQDLQLSVTASTWAMAWFEEGTYDPAADPDRDGYTNAEECLDCTNPHDAASRPVPPTLTLLENPPVRSPSRQWTGRMAAIQAHDNCAVRGVYVQTRLPGEAAWRTTEEDTDAANTKVTPLGRITEYRIGLADRLGQAYQEGRGGRADHLVWSDIFTLECKAPEPRLRASFNGTTLTLTNDNAGVDDAQSLTVTVIPQVYRRCTYEWSKEKLGRFSSEDFETVDLEVELPWEALSPSHQFTATYGDWYIALYATVKAFNSIGEEVFDTSLNLPQEPRKNPYTQTFRFDGMTKSLPITRLSFSLAFGIPSFVDLEALILEDDTWTTEGATEALEVTITPGETKDISLNFAPEDNLMHRRVKLTTNDPQKPTLTLRPSPGYRLRLR